MAHEFSGEAQFRLGFGFGFVHCHIDSYRRFLLRRRGPLFAGRLQAAYKCYGPGLGFMINQFTLRLSPFDGRSCYRPIRKYPRSCCWGGFSRERWVCEFELA